ncbi:MAG: class I SAM-dependent methyltransferase family protein [Candidatus Methanomethylophilaceae archaeon]|nr:class I SAM-dependent methyltransferase family protein [Candidatus Methanomethylophilaceae archaeon]
MRRVTFAKIRSEEAGPVIKRLMADGFVDTHAKIGKDDGYRYVPILPEHLDDEPVRSMELVEGDAHTLDRRPPQERIRAILGPELAGSVPDRWETVGDVVIIRLGPECWERREEIGRAYAQVLGAKSVCADVRGVSGEFRKPSMEVLYGTDTESVRLENGIRYRFDVTKVMFASGNTDERMRMRKLDCRGETVVDMFAGIGYFTLPLAKFSGARRVFACEKNPESYGFLVRNVADNGLLGTVIPILGDNRDIPGRAFADRILMGYVQTTSEFLPAALRMIKPNGIIHYHDTFYVNERDRRVKEIFDGACGEDGYEVLSIREVKSFAPSVSHYVADVRVRPSRRSCSR